MDSYDHLSIALVSRNLHTYFLVPRHTPLALEFHLSQTVIGYFHYTTPVYSDGSIYLNNKSVLHSLLSHRYKSEALHLPHAVADAISFSCGQ